MEYIDANGEIEVIGCGDFDLVKIFECGQCFRWDADEEGTYLGIAQGRAARLRQCGDSVFITATADEFDQIWRSYFDLDRDYSSIRKKLEVDDFMAKAIAFGQGIRILRQEHWEALCSFIISQNNNIPRIKQIISALCQHFGDAFEFMGSRLHTFPSAEKLAHLDIFDLAPINSGYRAAYIISAAKAVASGEIDLSALADLSPNDARDALKKLHGVGDKVADCTMLFGLHMLDSFPLDLWMKRAVNEQYGKNFDPTVFSPYAGIAQQYIFHYTRSMGKDTAQL